MPDSAHGAFSGPVFPSEVGPLADVFCLYEVSPFLSVVPVTYNITPYYVHLYALSSIDVSYISFIFIILLYTFY